MTRDDVLNVALDAINDLTERWDDPNLSGHLHKDDDDYQRLIAAHDGIVLGVIEDEHVETAAWAIETRLNEMAEGDAYDGIEGVMDDMHIALDALGGRAR